MESPKLLIEWHGKTPTAMCSVCRAIFPALDAHGRDANERLLESAFQDHVRAEHSSTTPMGNLTGWVALLT